MLQTQFEFTLPCGFVDEYGNLHRQGVMRRAIAADEIEPLADPRVRANQAYLVVLLLSRVVIRLGSLPSIPPAVIERLFATDFAYLQELYSQVNDLEPTIIETECPTCRTRFALNLMEANHE